MALPLLAAELPPRTSSPGASTGLILLHGYGSNERDLLELGAALDPTYHVIALRAPVRLDHNAYGWFEIQWEASGIRADEAQAANSVEMLNETVLEIANLATYGFDRLLIGGFSQGAMMSMAVASANPALLRGLLMMSGRIPPVYSPPVDTGALSALSALVQHGTRDQVLPVEGSREAANVLRQCGATVEYREYSMGHEVTGESLRDIEAWCRSLHS